MAMYFPTHAWRTILEYTLSDKHQRRVMAMAYFIRTIGTTLKPTTTIKEVMVLSFKNLKFILRFYDNDDDRNEDGLLHYYMKNLICLFYRRLMNCVYILRAEALDSGCHDFSVLENMCYSVTKDIFKDISPIDTFDEVIDEHEEHEDLFHNDFITIEEYDAFLRSFGIGSKKKNMLMKEIYLSANKNFITLNICEFVDSRLSYKTEMSLSSHPSIGYRYRI